MAHTHKRREVKQLDTQNKKTNHAPAIESADTDTQPIDTESQGSDVKPEPHDIKTQSKGNVLLYCGNGGILPNQFSNGLGSFFLLAKLYETLGYHVDYTTNWPASLETYRLVFLLLPGFDGKTDADFFSPIQLITIQSMLKKGGRLVLLAENGKVSGQTVINNLLLRLPCQLSLNKTLGVYDALTNLTNHQFVKGIKVINVSGYASLTTRGRIKVLASDPDGKAVIAMQKLGRYANGGEVILCGDSNILDDENINKPDNQLLAINLLL